LYKFVEILHKILFPNKLYNTTLKDIP